MSFVLDCSVTIAWIYPRETTPGVREVFHLLSGLLSTSGAWVPSLWRLEVANVLEMNRRRGRHDGSFRDAALADLGVLPIQTDPATGNQAWSSTLLLAEKYTLTVYDAAYLELAVRRGVPLATMDRELIAAAGQENVPVLG